MKTTTLLGLALYVSMGLWLACKAAPCDGWYAQFGTQGDAASCDALCQCMWNQERAKNPELPAGPVRSQLGATGGGRQARFFDATVTDKSCYCTNPVTGKESKYITTACPEGQSVCYTQIGLHD